MSSFNGNKSNQKTAAAGASSSRQTPRADPIAAFPRGVRIQVAPSGNPPRTMSSSRQVPTTARAGPITRAMSRTQSVGFVPTQREANRSAIFTPVSPNRSYSNVVASPPARSPATSPTGTSPGWSSTLVPAMIRHFEKHGIAISPSSPSRAPPPSPQTATPRTTSPLVKVAAMVTQAKTIEEQLAEIQAALKERDEQIMARDAQILARDAQIAKMMEKFEALTSQMGDVSQVAERAPAAASTSSTLPPIIQTVPEVQPIARELRFDEPGALTMDALNELISNAVRNTVSGEATQSQSYLRPYTRRIQALPMPLGYHPPKFQLFNGDGNPKQHIAHFIETCNNAGTYGDLLVRQFARSLKGNAFDWFIELPQESIDSWEQLEHEFLSRFYSTKRLVTLVELTNLKQKRGEKVVEYINRWRNLSLNCKESTNLSSKTAIEMCIGGMNWGLLYFLQSQKPKDFQELATEAHNMEILIEQKGEGNPPIDDPDKKGKSAKKEYKAPQKDASKGSYVANVTGPPKIAPRVKSGEASK